MSNLVVSVIIPAYNAELFITRCLRSLLAQSIKKEYFEIIVIDDFSTDNTKAVIDVFQNNIVYLRNNKQLGLPGSLNVGIKKARGSYIVRVDSDDYVHKDFLKVLYLHLQLNKNIDAIACDYLKVDSFENAIEHCDAEKKPIGCGIMFRIEQMIEMGLYDPNFKMAEEEEFRLRFEKNYRISYTKIPLYRYRQHGFNMSKNIKEKNKFQKKINKKHLT